MATYEERLTTFTSWPHTRPDPETLATNGFQFVPSKESPDNVHCTECSTDFNGWRPRINPFAWHLKSSPTCPFIKRHERMLYNSSRRSGLEYALEQDQLRRIAPQRDQKWKDQLQQWEDEDREEELREKEEKEDQKPTPTPYSIGFFDPSLQQDFPELRLYHDVGSFTKHTKECSNLYREADILQLLPKCLRGPAFTWYQSIQESLKDADLTKCIEVLISKFKKQPQQQPPHSANQPVSEALHAAPQAYIEYHKCTVCSASFSSLSRLLSHAQTANCNKACCEHCEEKFDSNNKLHEHLGTCSATKPRKTTAKAASTTISNADIAVKKEGIDRTATTTATVAVAEISLPASQLATQSTTKKLATPPAISAATQPAFQQATQKGTTQAANETAAFKEVLEIAISTPLPKAFKCRRCPAEFSFNSQLHRHIRESHSIGTASSTVHSAFKNSGPSSASQVIPPLSTHLATSATTSYTWTANRASPTATPPPTYRAVSPPPPEYQATPKAYLTVQNLYMRYAPLKSNHPAKLAPKTRAASYLTVQDLYKRFHKSSKKPHFCTANRTTAFGPKQLSKSAPLVSKASTSIEKNTGKAVHSTIKSSYSQIGPSGIKPAFDSKISSMNSFWASRSNTKTPFPLRQKLNTQALTMQSPCYMRSPKHARMVARIQPASYERPQQGFKLANESAGTPWHGHYESAYGPAKLRTLGLPAI